MPNVSFAATVVLAAKIEMTAAVDQTVDAGMETMTALADETPPMVTLSEITIEMTTRYNMR
jgi:hypothetical protein